VREFLATAICAFILLPDCSSAPKATPVTVPPDWRYEKNAIDLHIKADPKLNLFHKSPHTLLLWSPP